MKKGSITNGRMSPTIFRYILNEMLFAFFVSFLFFFFIFFVNQLLVMARQILEKRVSLDQVVLLVIYSLPSIIAIAMPFAALLGTLMTLGRLSSDNEILVVFTSGLSYKNIFTPVFLVGFFISVVSFGVNDVLLPMGTIRFVRLYRNILLSTPALEIEANSVTHFRDTVLITGNVSKNKIDDMLILDKTSEGERRVIMAKSAEFAEDDEMGINLDLTDAFIHSSKENERSDYDYAFSDTLSYRIQENDIMQDFNMISAREMSSKDVYLWIKKRELTVDSHYSELNKQTLETAITLENTLKNGPEGRGWNQRETQLNVLKRRELEADTIRNDRQLSVFRLEFFKKFSMPAGALSLIFLALPIGLTTKKSGQVIGFIFGMFISVAYWALLLIGQNMGIKLGYSPFWTMWLPNILSITIGLILCVRRVRK
jgi:lipopolysaccharide export system permease protein